MPRRRSIRHRAIRGIVVQAAGALTFLAVAVYFGVKGDIAAAVVFALLTLVPICVARLWLLLLNRQDHRDT